MAERFKAPVLKTGEGESPPWVRIPLHPPFSPKLPELKIHPWDTGGTLGKNRGE